MSSFSLFSVFFNCYFTNIFCLLNPQKIAKIKFYKSDLLSFTCFGMNKAFLHVYVFFIHVVNFISWVCMLWIWNSQWLEIIILRSPEKGVPWKFWLDLRFPRDPKLKWILKWLSLDRGYFKFYFYKRGKSTNNFISYVPLDS